MKNIVHHISLKNIGGMQDAFISYYNELSDSEKNNIEIYGNFSLEKKFYNVKNYYKLGLNFFNWFKFIKRLRDRKIKKILHGLLNSRKFNLLLKFFKSNNLVFYEHGSIWNSVKSEQKLVIENSNYSNLIIANSNATKNILNKKFRIRLNKIKVIYYGFKKNNSIKYSNNKNKKFVLGYLGRFDSHKGIHTLLNCANKLERNFEIKLAGDGDLYNYFLNKYSSNKNIKFAGRIKNISSFFSKIDCLIVPSIREPLGIVLIHAGLHKVPVIASNVDGIREVVKPNFGILIKPTLKLNRKIFNISKIKRPDTVLDLNNKLSRPKEIDPKILLRKIYLLKHDKNLRNFYVKNFYNFSIKAFSSREYFNNLKRVFDEKN